MRSLSTTFDSKRLALALPMLLVVAVAVYWFVERSEPSDDTPSAVLVDTPNPAAQEVGGRRNQLARDFSGTAPDGATTRLSELRGQPTIINFWATWCSSCLAELPDFRAVQEEFGADRLHRVAILAEDVLPRPEPDGEIRAGMAGLPPARSPFRSRERTNGGLIRLDAGLPAGLLTDC